MGLLDDAIKEHLELKRKHGVPEDEVQRQEEEALGPARRDVAQQPEEAELAAGATATAEAEHDEASRSSEEGALFDMEAPEAEAPEVEHEKPAAVEPEEAAAEAPVVDEPPGGMESPEPAEPEPEHTEPTPVEPPPVEPPPAAEESAPYLGDTEPHGFEAVERDEDLDEDKAVVEDKTLDGDEDQDEDRDEDGDEDQDVLEDTPDFLQETPEHDRLWFEQKPPRDFDFD